MKVIQWPNKPLSLALVAAALNLFVHGLIHAFVTAVFYMALTIWAYLEASQGDGRFRKMLGYVFLAYILFQLGTHLPK